MSIEKLLTEKEAAALVSVRAQTLSKWRMLGEGPPFTRVGRAIRYRLSLLMDWLEARTVHNV